MSGRRPSSGDEMPETISEVVPAACVEVIRQVWDRLDDHLCSDESDVVQLHIDDCAHCRGFERFQIGYRDVMRSVRTDSTSAPWTVRARVLDALADAGFCP
jgi:transcription elongation factor GreA-like protein